MIKYLSATELIDKNNGEDTSGITECLKENLIKPVGKEHDEPLFLVLEENLETVKEILKEDFQDISEYDFLGWVEIELTEATFSMEVENAYDDKIEIRSEDMFDIISDDLDCCIDDSEKIKIYEAEDSRRALQIMLNELGRNELQNRLDDFKGRLKDPIFI